MTEGWKLGLIFMATKLAGMPCSARLPPPPASSSSPISRCRRLVAPAAASAKAIVKTYIYGFLAVYHYCSWKRAN